MAAGDLARSGALSIFGKIEEIRADQERFETARLRSKHGKERVETRDQAARVRLERGKAAAEIGETNMNAVLRAVKGKAERGSAKYGKKRPHSEGGA